MTRRHATAARRAFATALLLAGLTACSETADRPLPPAGPDGGVHPAGFLQQDSAQFHGQAIRAAGWDMSSCQSCHGADYAGDFTGVSCLTCHENSPESCTTCHGGAGRGPAPPEDLSGNVLTSFMGVGAHQAHLTTQITEPLACGDCHVFGGYDDAAHIDSTTPGRAELNFGERARLDGTPTYDPATGSCANTYCHGGGQLGLGQPVVWTEVGSGPTDCSSCHAMPPAPESGHPPVPDGVSCHACHNTVVDADNNIIDVTRHINGQTDLSQAPSP